LFTQSKEKCISCRNLAAAILE